MPASRSPISDIYRSAIIWPIKLDWRLPRRVSLTLYVTDKDYRSDPEFYPWTPRCLPETFAGVTWKKWFHCFGTIASYKYSNVEIWSVLHHRVCEVPQMTLTLIRWIVSVVGIWSLVIGILFHVYTLFGYNVDLHHREWKWPSLLQRGSLYTSCCALFVAVAASKTCLGPYL